MELVGAGLGHDADNRAGRVRVFGAEVVSLHAEFFDGVRVRELAAIVLIRVRVGGAVQQEIDARIAAAVHDEAVAHDAGRGLRLKHACLHRHQLSNVPPVQRQIFHALLINDTLERAALVSISGATAVTATV